LTDLIKSKFLKTIQKQKLINNNERVLLAVSGGMDSMCMVQLFMSINQPIGIAHLDHQLRGEESDQDRKFVERFAKINDIPLYCKQVDILALSLDSTQSKSEIGRDQRYLFFQEICTEHQFTKIATAHHLDDRIETFIMRAMTGAGLEGLSSIPYHNGNVIRPFLDISRSEIESFVKDSHIEYREDSSNKKTDYLRNSIRHQLLPAIEKIMPSYRKTMATSIENVGDSHQLLQSLLANSGQQTEPFDYKQISIPENNKGRLTYLHYHLKDFGFSRTQLKNIIDGDHSGALVESETHELLRNRHTLVLREKEDGSSSVDKYLIKGPGDVVLKNGDHLSISATHEHLKSTHPLEEIVDADKLAFPLTLRRWQEGDTFKPLGMGGKRQGLQDFFTNNKLSIFEKEQVWVLSSADTIYWIVGHRISHDIRLTPQTTSKFRLKYKHNNA